MKIRVPFPVAGGLLGVSVFAAVGLIAFQGGLLGPDSESPAATTCEVARPHAAPIGGVSLVAPRRPMGPEAVTPLRRVGAGWVAVLPYAFLEPDGGIRFEAERRWWGEGMDGLASTIRTAHAEGLRVAVKPHLWAGRAGWVGDYAPESEEGWERFDLDYTRYVLAMADLADSLGADMLVVGTELDRTARERPELWTRLIDRVRSRYDGPLTYAANWDGFQDIDFWDRLDYIGVDAYFPLSPRDAPDRAELEAAWAPLVRELAAFCREHQRPILFTEFGYRSIDGTAGNQWELPPEGRSEVPVNLDAQIVAYEALFRTWWERPWFAGGFLWKWFPEDVPRGERLRADFTPQHKPVEALIREWYAETPNDPPAASRDGGRRP